MKYANIIIIPHITSDYNIRLTCVAPAASESAAYRQTVTNKPKKTEDNEKFNTNGEKGIAITQNKRVVAPPYFQRFATTHLFFNRHTFYTFVK